MKRAYSGEPSMRVSHETIYRTIYLAGRRELGPKPGKHLRSGRTVRHARGVKGSHGRGLLRNLVSIRERVPSHPLESPRSCHLPVFMKQATEAISTLHAASQGDNRVGWRTGHSLIEALVRPGLVVVIDELGQHLLWLPPSHRSIPKWR